MDAPSTSLNACAPRAPGADVIREFRAHFTYDAETGAFARDGRPCRVSISAAGYRRIPISGQWHLAHRLAWLYAYGEWPALTIDHINCNRLDNRMANLRLATVQQQCANRSARAGSGLKGVFRTVNRWGATIWVNGKNLYLGSFLTAEAAHEAYCRKAREVHGEFARGR